MKFPLQHCSVFRVHCTGRFPGTEEKKISLLLLSCDRTRASPDFTHGVLLDKQRERFYIWISLRFANYKQNLSLFYRCKNNTLSNYQFVSLNKSVYTSDLVSVSFQNRTSEPWTMCREELALLEASAT